MGSLPQRRGAHVTGCHGRSCPAVPHFPHGGMRPAVAHEAWVERPLAIPLLDLKREYQAIKAEVDAALAEVVADQGFVLGPRVQVLEARIAAFCGTQHAVGVASGTDAILLALMALGVGPGDEVITTPFTFFATAGGVARVGARPVFVDIDPQTYNINPAAVEAAITGRTRAVVAVDLYGQCADYAALRAVTGRGIFLIEDAAQAFGAVRDGRRAGALADIGCLSFYPTKNLGAYGDAGMVLVDDDALVERLIRLREHGESRSDRRYVHTLIGTNSRLDALQAAVLLVKLDRVEVWNRRRAQLAARYDAAFAGTDIVTPWVAPRASHVYHQYVVRVPDRDEVGHQLRRAGVGHAVFYPIPLHLQPCFADLGYGEGDLPEAERAAREVLALPIFPFLTEKEQDQVIAAVRSAVGAAEVRG